MTVLNPGIKHLTNSSKIQDLKTNYHDEHRVNKLLFLVPPFVIGLLHSYKMQVSRMHSHLLQDSCQK